MGEYSHSIDTKGRLIMPSKFREMLGEQFVVTKGLDGCLFVYDQNEWTAFEEKLKSLLWKLFAVAALIGIWQGTIEIFHIKKSCDSPNKCSLPCS